MGATSFELEGSIKLIQDPQTFKSGFSKREFVLEVEDGKFPQLINFECLKEKASLLDSVSAGDRVKVHFDIRGREYNDRYFVNLAAWKIEKAGEGGGQGGAQPGGEEPPAEPNFPVDEGDDIPF